jgi:hypothetical protein
MEDLETGITAIRRKTEGQQMWGVAMPLKPRNLKKNRKMLRNWLLQLVGAKRAPRKLLLRCSSTATFSGQLTSETTRATDRALGRNEDGG